MTEWLSMMLLATVLGMDAFAIAMALGFQSFRFNAFKVGAIVGLFHMLMPLLGIGIGHWMTSMYSFNVAHFIAGFILVWIGVQMMISSRKREETSLHLRGLGLFLFAFVVSMDSFSIGISLGIFGAEAILVILSFGFTSAFLTWLGLILATLIRYRIGHWGEMLGGIILLLFGLNTLWY
ncbi:manganese efflux pump MntP family protein [Natribacillus halophilus]|uniref:Putative manganese efflux pump MntP n=1 Tax=Natribacillus halophilus TaxID=549003 RepID=A0A1G8KUR1_9BACI|nr:manganese efflux pump [Natribacillus halophilus]SDI47245.1 Putative Mn2+ efflux pump MntP [Natribacillus halophilus]